jgi:hypothetical protein
MSREDHHHEEDLEEDILEQSHCFRPRVYEGEWHESMPYGFDAVTIHLDGRMQSDLNWKKGQEQAQQAIEKGYALMWNMQMGLFCELIHPLTHQAQFLSLTLALEHFRDSLWKEFKSHTLGVTLFRGSADFSLGFRWDDHQEQNLLNWFHDINASHLAALDLAQIKEDKDAQQFVRLYCRDVAIEYLALLATRLPDSLPAYLFLDTQLLPRSYVAEMQILNPERFDRLHLALQGHQLPFHSLGWRKPTAQGYSGHSLVNLPDIEAITVGVCVPPMHFYHSQHYAGLEEGISALQQHSIPFKLIAESHLTAQWDGLDYLLFSPNGLTMQGKRRLQGFCAAGGTAISTGHLIGLPYEVGLKEWLDSQIS